MIQRMAIRAPLLDNGYIRIKRCRRGLFIYNVNDRFIGQSLDKYGEWSESEMRFLGQFVSEGMTVLDIGANIGTHTVYFAQRVGPTGSVLAFEPQLVVYQILNGNIAINGLSNVRALNAAVGRENGRVKIPTIDPTTLRNFGAVAIGREGSEVACYAIDGLPMTSLHFVKIDVEGYELEVLKGAKNTIERFRPILFVENNSDKSPELITHVRQMGYRGFWQIGPHYDPDNYFKNKENIFEGYVPVANIICFPAERCPTGLFEAQEGDDWRKAVTRARAA